MKRKILVASTNPGKLAELKGMLDADVEWISLADIGDIGQIEEDGATFAENARKKALGYAEATGLWTIADDSGLCIDALDGRPGIKSARFSTDEQIDRKLLDEKNVKKVLTLMGDIAQENRTARFICHLSLASPQEVLIEADGVLEGLITKEAAGENGFGYDPIFFVPELGKTVAQLAPGQKNAISHRGNAIRKLRPLLDKLLEQR